MSYHDIPTPQQAIVDGVGDSGGSPERREPEAAPCVTAGRFCKIEKSLVSEPRVQHAK